ncbi:hypothetical protein HOB94_00310, partial [bacterium]|nr:hypothetical protein [bacterium]
MYFQSRTIFQSSITISLSTKSHNQEKSCSTIITIFHFFSIFLINLLTIHFNFGDTHAVGSSSKYIFVSCKYNLAISNNLICHQDRSEAL